jgi:hypothetical protein
MEKPEAEAAPVDPLQAATYAITESYERTRLPAKLATIYGNTFALFNAA